MDIRISLFNLSQLIEQAAELGACHALTKSGKLKPYLSKAEAFRQYGRAKIERWINDDLITPRKDGGNSACWRIDRLEVETIAKSLAISQFIKPL